MGSRLLKSEPPAAGAPISEPSRTFGWFSIKAMRFNELIRLLEANGFRLAKEKGSIRYYSKPGHNKLIRVDYHASKEVPTGTCHAILKAAGITKDKKD